MSAASNVHRLPNRDAALKALYEELATKNMFPFWAQSSNWSRWTTPSDGPSC
jgi:hypothetical protein